MVDGGGGGGGGSGVKSNVCELFLSSSLPLCNRRDGTSHRCSEVGGLRELWLEGARPVPLTTSQLSTILGDIRIEMSCVQLIGTISSDGTVFTLTGEERPKVFK